MLSSDEARERMLEMQKTTHTTRVSGAEGENAASVLGISALIINDFKQKRTRDYKFSWEQALNPRWVGRYGLCVWCGGGLCSRTRKGSEFTSQMMR